MRLTALVLFALLAASCAGDEPDDAPPQQTVPQTAPPPNDTTAPDTVAMTEGDGPGATRGPGGRVEPGARQDGDARAAAAARTEAGTEGERLYTVQIAAFVEEASAREWTDRLRRQGMPVWTSMAEVGGRTFHRVRVGVAPSVTEARRVGSMIKSRYEWPVWVAPLTPADRPPEDAAQETRRLLGSGR